MVNSFTFQLLEIERPFFFLKKDKFYLTKPIFQLHYQFTLKQSLILGLPGHILDFWNLTKYIHIHIYLEF